MGQPETPFTMPNGKTSAIANAGELDNQRLKYFAVIDQLRALGINEELPLPQIVAVGDQSSGKSSLLEGLTGTPFPVASDLCTRFATQLVMRRAPDEEPRAKVSIIPGPSASEDEEMKAKLLGFALESKKDEFTDATFASALEEAAALMGLPTSDVADIEGFEKRFSDDILRIELSGPDEQHLSVVDVPGLFHNPTKYQTKEDLLIIRNLIERYTTDSRTIILAVMDGRNNLANQEVFKLARAADPEGIRTVGIITKCDALQKGEEQGVLKIAQNTVEHLKHGWFTVRNRSAQDIKKGVTIKQRHENERIFFQTAPWDTLPKGKVGIGALKPFLGHLLYEHIRREFPSLVKDIEGIYDGLELEQTQLGPARQTTNEQRQYLTRLASKLQRNVSDALHGNYDAALEAKSCLKLRMHLRVAAEDFANSMTVDGHRLPFQNVDDSIDSVYDRTNKQEKNIRDWILDIYRDSRGAELPGTVNPSVIETTFRQQSIEWEEISKKYLLKAVDLIKSYQHVELERVEPDERIREAIAGQLDEKLRRASSLASDQVECLLKDERKGILQTVNHYFADNLNDTREQRVVARLKRLGLQDGHNYTVNIEQLTRTAHLSNEQQAVNDIHDILKSYYKVAVKRFMDNVVVSAVERILLGNEGSIKSFSADSVGLMSNDQLSDIAGESYSTSKARIETSSKLNRYLKALELVRSV